MMKKLIMVIGLLATLGFNSYAGANETDTYSKEIRRSSYAAVAESTLFTLPNLGTGGIFRANDHITLEHVNWMQQFVSDPIESDTGLFARVLVSLTYIKIPNAKWSHFVSTLMVEVNKLNPPHSEILMDTLLTSERLKNSTMDQISSYVFICGWSSCSDK
jgi:hypothetical protein